LATNCFHAVLNTHFLADTWRPFNERNQKEQTQTEPGDRNENGNWKVHRENAILLKI